MGCGCCRQQDIPEGWEWWYHDAATYQGRASGSGAPAPSCAKALSLEPLEAEPLEAEHREVLSDSDDGSPMALVDQPLEYLRGEEPEEQEPTYAPLLPVDLGMPPAGSEEEVEEVEETQEAVQQPGQDKQRQPTPAAEPVEPVEPVEPDAAEGGDGDSSPRFPSPCPDSVKGQRSPRAEEGGGTRDLELELEGLEGLEGLRGSLQANISEDLLARLAGVLAEATTAGPMTTEVQGQDAFGADSDPLHGVPATELPCLGPGASAKPRALLEVSEVKDLQKMWPPYSAPCANCTLWATVEGPQATLENAFQGFARKGFLEPREEAAPDAQTAVPQRAVPVPAPGAAPAKAEPAPAKVLERAAVVREKAELPSVPSKFSAEARAEDPAQMAQIPLRALEEPTLARVLSDMASLVATLEARHRVDWAPGWAPKPPKPMAAQPIEPIDPIEPIKLELDRLHRIQISVVHAIGRTAQAVLSCEVAGQRRQAPLERLLEPVSGPLRLRLPRFEAAMELTLLSRLGEMWLVLHPGITRYSVEIPQGPSRCQRQSLELQVSGDARDGCQDVVEKHKRYLESLIQAALSARPVDPFDFMAKQARSLRAAACETQGGAESGCASGPCDLRVLRAEGLPPETLLTVRCGHGESRQAPLSHLLDGRKRLKISDGRRPLQVQVLLPESAARLPTSPGVQEIHFPRQGEILGLRVRVAGEAHAMPPSRPPQGSAEQYLFQHRLLAFAQGLLHDLVQAPACFLDLLDARLRAASASRPGD